MSLFQLKTRDLSWQDHTVNTEAMLAPARSGLLMNKHKTLAAKCVAALHLYERQRSQRLQDFQAARRLLDRQRHRLLKAQSQICARSRLNPPSPPVPSREHTSANAGRRDTPLKNRNLRRELPERSASAPVGVLQNARNSPTEKPLPSLQGTQPRQGAQPRLQLLASVFLTDGDGSSASMSSVSSNDSSQSSARDSLVVPQSGATRAAVGAGRAVSVRFTEPRPRKAAREDDGEKPDDNDHKQRRGRSQKTLEERVQVFVADLRAFNSRSPDAIWRQIRKDDGVAGKEDEEEERKRKQELAAGAQRWKSRDPQPSTSAGEKLERGPSTWHTEGQARVLAAFDAFCQHGAVEELTRAMRLASRFKIYGPHHRRPISNNTNTTTTRSNTNTTTTSRNTNTTTTSSNTNTTTTSNNTNKCNDEVLVSTMSSFRSTRGYQSLVHRQQQQTSV